MRNQYLFRQAQLNLLQAQDSIANLRFTAKEVPASSPQALNRQINRVTWSVSQVTSHLIEVDRAIAEINTVVESQAETFSSSLLSVIIKGYQSLRNQYNAIFDELQALLKGFEQQLV